MTRRQWLSVAPLLAVLSDGACARHDGPEDPIWGKAPCAHCAMLIGDKRYAAQVLADDGTRSHFDDVGCLFAFVAEHATRVAHAWVRDELGDAWLPSEAARFHTGARTPMGYGLGAGVTGPLSFDEARREALSRARSQR